MSVTEDHLIKLQTYLSKHLHHRPRAQCIRNELLTTYLGSNHDENVDSFVNRKICPRCFNTWNEGNFVIKTKSKNSKSQVNKQVIIKCLVCQKLSVMHHLSGKRGVQWKCARDRIANECQGDGKSSKTSSRNSLLRKFEAIAESNTSINCNEGLKKRKIQNFPKTNEDECSKGKRKKVTKNVSNDSLKNKRRQKFRMTSKVNRTNTLNVCDTSRMKQKKIALEVLNDLL